MSIFTIIRDALGIGLDRKLKKKADLEIEELKSKKQEKLIKPADQKDVEKYDPKTKELVGKLKWKYPRVRYYRYPFSSIIVLITAITIAIFFLEPRGTISAWSLLLGFLGIVVSVLLTIVIIRVIITVIMRLAKRKKRRNQLFKKKDNNNT